MYGSDIAAQASGSNPQQDAINGLQNLLGTLGGGQPPNIAGGGRVGGAQGGYTRGGGA